MPPQHPRMMAWRPILDRRIEELRQLREEVTGCIGCGCLSLKTCALANPADQAATSGSGARYLLTTQNEDGASTDTG